MSVPKAVTPGLPCGVALGFPAALTLSFAPTMCPLQRPRPSPPADASIWLPCSSPCDVGTYRVPEPAANLKFLKNIIFFKNDFVPSAVSCALPAFLLFFL
ncbi:unnamed protein product, partial [Staurois parvus]